MAALTLVTLRLARLRNLGIMQGSAIIEALRKIPAQIQQILDRASEIEALAEQFAHSNNALYLGRGVNFPVALEGALKLKEISYIHAEGYPAAEMKHGPIALIDENMPVVFIAPKDTVYGKIVSNIEEVKARGGKVIAIVNEKDVPRSACHGLLLRDPDDDQRVDAAAHDHPVAAVLVLRGGAPGMQRGPAAEPGQVSDGGVAGELITPHSAGKALPAAVPGAFLPTGL